MTQAKRIAYICIACFLIIIGLAGIVLPVLNGLIFILLGLILLSFESPYIEYKLQQLSAKNPHVEKWYKKLDGFMRKIFK